VLNRWNRYLSLLDRAFFAFEEYPARSDRLPGYFENAYHQLLIDRFDPLALVGFGSGIILSLYCVAHLQYTGYAILKKYVLYMYCTLQKSSKSVSLLNINTRRKYENTPSES
jgi:hypothetical protein